MDRNLSHLFPITKYKRRVTRIMSHSFFQASLSSEPDEVGAQNTSSCLLAKQRSGTLISKALILQTNIRKRDK